MQKLAEDNAIIPIERIAEKIYIIRGVKVMLDADLANLYAVLTKRLNEQVKRNLRRFPKDFMFQLTAEEFQNLKSQIATANFRSKTRTTPYAFTEQGVAMLSSVLHSDRAIDINLAIIRIFVRMREFLATHKDLAKKVEQHDKQIANLYSHVEKLLSPDVKNNKKQIGFIWENEHKDKQKRAKK